MKKKIMEKWVAALRSGEFKQGTGSLCNNGKHCCLGVLSDLALVGGAVSYEGELYDGDHEYGREKDTAMLPEEVIKWAGMKGCEGEFKSEGQLRRLWELNDNGRSFNEIADIIEKNWRKL